MKYSIPRPGQAWWVHLPGLTGATKRRLISIGNHSSGVFYVFEGDSEVYTSRDVIFITLQDAVSWDYGTRPGLDETVLELKELDDEQT